MPGYGIGIQFAPLSRAHELRLTSRFTEGAMGFLQKATTKLKSPEAKDRLPVLRTGGEDAVSTSYKKWSDLVSGLNISSTSLGAPRCAVFF